MALQENRLSVFCASLVQSSPNNERIFTHFEGHFGIFVFWVVCSTFRYCSIVFCSKSTSLLVFGYFSICRFVWVEWLMWLWHGIKDGCYNWELVQDQPLHSSQWRVQHAKCVRITWWDGDADQEVFLDRLMDVWLIFWGFSLFLYHDLWDFQKGRGGVLIIELDYLNLLYICRLWDA